MIRVITVGWGERKRELNCCGGWGPRSLLRPMHPAHDKDVNKLWKVVQKWYKNYGPQQERNYYSHRLALHRGSDSIYLYWVLYWCALHHASFMAWPLNRTSLTYVLPQFAGRVCYSRCWNFPCVYIFLEAVAGYPLHCMTCALTLTCDNCTWSFWILPAPERYVLWWWFCRTLKWGAVIKEIKCIIKLYRRRGEALLKQRGGQ